jgi:AcrR family transcriptional regulator
MIKTRRRVKRPYSSPLRDDQARETSQAIVDAAAALFAEKGYAAVSVDAIASAAGVSRATVFTSVGGKPALLKAAYAAAFGRAAGDPGQAMPLVERPRSRAVRAEPTARGYIDAYSALAASIHHHLSGIHRALVEAAAADGEARELMERVLAERRRGADTIVADVRARAPLREGLDLVRAADAVWALIDPTWFHMLVHDRGWTEEQFREWLAHALASELLGDRAKKR